jgi:carboxymethylenebutenolidase
MGTTIELTAADGHKLSAYLAEPKGKARGALVVVQEIFGVNKHMKEVTDGFAADGYLSICPAFFDRKERNFDHGYTQADIDAGRTIAMSLNWDNTIADVQAAIDRIKGAGKVGIVGYCWGGTTSWVAASRAKGLSCSAPFYGGGISNMTDEKPKVPVMMHWGETDHAIPMEAVRKVEAAHPTQKSFVYPAGHGFNCDHRGSYHAESAKLARSRTIEFFQKNIG